MNINITRNRKGCTLVEIMIVVAIIALLAAIALPNFLRSRKRSQATRILEDLRLLDAACDQYAIDTAKVAGFNPTFSDLQNYVKTDTVLATTGADLYGNTYGPFTVDSVVQVSTSDFNTLSDVADASFWGQYYQPASADSGSGGSTPVDPAALAAAQATLNSAQSNYNSILAQYNADMAANIGGQPRKDITYAMEAATQQLNAAQSAYTSLTSGSSAN